MLSRFSEAVREKFTVVNEDGSRSAEPGVIIRFAVRWAPLVLAVLVLIPVGISFLDRTGSQEADHAELESLITEREDQAAEVEEEYFSTYRQMLGDFSELDLERIDADLDQAHQQVVAEGFGAGAEGEVSLSWRLLGLDQDDPGYRYTAVFEVREIVEDEAEDQSIAQADLPEATQVGHEVFGAVADEGQTQLLDQALVEFTSFSAGDVSSLNHYELSEEIQHSWSQEQIDEGDADADDDDGNNE